jgi:long-chain acyl-CoA synthetase
MGTRTVFAVLAETAARFGGNHALHQPIPGGKIQKYRSWTWLEYKQTVIEIACGLRRFGINTGDVVALDSETRAEFYLADIGVMSCGAISAALYVSYPPADLVRNIQHCAAKAVFVEDPRTLETLREAARDSLDVRWFLLTGSAPGATSLEDLCEAGRQAMRATPDLFERIQASYGPGDPAILYLTSGATGEPKMGLVLNGSVAANLDVGPAVLPVGPDDVTIAFLPSAHIAQRVVLELLPVRMGAPVWFSQSLSQFPHELKTLRPTWLLAPPRLWERIHSSICTEVRKQPGHVRKIFYIALGLGLEAAVLRQEGSPIPVWIKAALPWADRLVFRKIRERLGGRLRIAASGSAPLGRDLALFFDAIGMPLIEGYGLTEGGIVSFNPLDRPRAGSIGKALPGVDVRIAEDGELLLKSGYGFDGYYKDPAATAAVLRDGWLATGDIAEVDSAGYIYITGRKKELIVASNGKKIYPSKIESLLRTEPLISHVLLLGDHMPFVAALLTLDPAVAAQRSPEETQRELREAVARVNRQLAPFEQVRKFRVLDREFSMDYGELTPTMKVRRQRVLENFRSVVQEIYGKD